MSSRTLYERSLLNELADFAQNRPTVMQVLIGPRQVGKTTLARQLMERISFPALYASADAPLPPGPEWIESHWLQAERSSEQRHGPVLLILDEIQKVRGWSETLKRRWDARTARGFDIRVLALGSSSLLLQEGLSESLAGRFFLHRCAHWTFAECRSAFGWSLPQWLFYGGYPGAEPFLDSPEAWKRYIADALIETVLARDVLQLQRVAKPALLRHLFLLAASYPAHILSYNKMLGQLQDAGNTTTLAHYLRLLESAFLITGLLPFSSGAVRRRAGSPKLVLWNNALVNALGRQSFEEAIADAPWWGRLVENAVGAHLLNGLASPAFSVSYWRQGEREVDYVVERGTGVWALEVKSGRGRKCSGLEAFQRAYPRARALLIGGEGIPLETFFESNPEDWFKP